MTATTYTVRAKRWAHGWELHVNDGEVGVTQSRTLAGAERMVRDYIESLYEIDVTEATVTIVPELGGLGERVREAKERSRAAKEAQRAAVLEAREVARALRADGLSVTDTATVMGVSRGRVSQLVS